MNQEISLLSIGQVLKLTAMSRSYCYDLQRRGEFPTPVRLSPTGRRVAWRHADVMNWVAERAPANQ